jgi:hypothetical protein
MNKPIMKRRDSKEVGEIITEGHGVFKTPGVIADVVGIGFVSTFGRPGVALAWHVG